MKRVDRILQHKGREIFRVAPETSVYEAIEQMAQRGIGALLVMDQERLVGILSERDYARKVILQGKSSRQTPVSEIMTREVQCIPPDLRVEEAMALMTDKRIRHLPVVESDRVVGIISIGDVVRTVIDEQEFHIQQLEKYILSGG
jgi:CBS domain-containing protein